MIGSLTHRFEVVIRPLRDKDGERQTVFLSARTAAQATREATARWPSMKVIAVGRVLDRVVEMEREPERGSSTAPVALRRVGS